MYALHDIYASLQGEGRWTGRPATFVQFVRCNLMCPWCDSRHHVKMDLDLRETIDRIAHLRRRSVILTGGEPSIQPGLRELVEALKERGYWVALETNGLRRPEGIELFDYVSVSPKFLYRRRYLDDTMLRQADEVRIVAEELDMAEFCEDMRRRITAKDWYVSALEQANKIHYRRAFDLLSRLNRRRDHELPPWMLSIQTQKVLGIK